MPDPVKTANGEVLVQLRVHPRVGRSFTMHKPGTGRVLPDGRRVAPGKLITFQGGGAPVALPEDIAHDLVEGDRGKFVVAVTGGNVYRQNMFAYYQPPAERATMDVLLPQIEALQAQVDALTKSAGKNVPDAKLGEDLLIRLEEQAPEGGTLVGHIVYDDQGSGVCPICRMVKTAPGLGQADVRRAIDEHIEMEHVDAETLAGETVIAEV